MWTSRSPSLELLTYFTPISQQEQEIMAIPAPDLLDINSFLCSGCAPDLFNLACVQPPLKGPTLDPAVEQNLQPISNFHFVSKILAKHIKYQVSGREHMSYSRAK